MKLSINWLENFLFLDGITPEEVASKLTMSSFEVEEISKVGPKLQGPIIVGKILDIQKHPNADKLSVTKVTTDGINELQIVCGAKNIKVGQLIPVSLPGAIVINRHDNSELLIKISKIRDIESFGMLCSGSELGIKSQVEDGIYILNENATLGISVIDYLALKQDTVLEVGSRSNRGDALSVYGLCKEISALTGKKTKEIIFKTPKTASIKRNIVSQIENTNDTYVFYTVTIENIKVSQSPQWLQKLLEAAGIRSINNLVDITNYINFSFGQPLHAYDLDKLNGEMLTARFAKRNEKILTLDGKDKELNNEILVIADKNGPVAISGIMGGKDSEVTEDTRDIVIEAAVFNPMKVRRGSRAVGITTEASKRFERGVDKSFTYKVLLKTIELIEQLAGTSNTQIGPINQAGNPEPKEIIIRLTKQEVSRVLGINLDIKVISQLLENIEFKVRLLNENEIEVQVPHCRSTDVTRPIDLIEEVARFYGYDLIPELPPPNTIAANKSRTALEIVKNHFLACGFSEVYLSSLIGEEILKNKEFAFNDTSKIAMLNPLSIEHSVLRQAILPGLLEALKLNQSYKVNSIRLFEIGRAYYFDNSKMPTEKETNITEDLKLGALLAGYEENWFTNQALLQKSINLLFFSLKGIIESFFMKNDLHFKFTPTKVPFLHPNLSLKLEFNNKEIGILGCLHPKIEKRLELIGPVLLFEVSLNEILKQLTKNKIFKKISSQPVVTRDITVDISKNYSANLIQDEINKVTPNFLINVNLVSVFELDKETKSLTFRLKMQDFEQTLTSNHIEDEINKIKKHLTACFQSKFRV